MSKIDEFHSTARALDELNSSFQLFIDSSDPKLSNRLFTLHLTDFLHRPEVLAAWTAYVDGLKAESRDLAIEECRRFIEVHLTSPVIST
jgi:hypothetical protein